MKKHYRYVRKFYAMQRMARAIERAIASVSLKETDRAIRWVAAWGLLCGIQTPGVRLRDSDVALETLAASRQPSDQIDVPSVSAFTLTEEMVAKHAAQETETMASGRQHETPSPNRKDLAPD